MAAWKVVPALAAGFIAVSALIGILLGGFLDGALTDRFGRRVFYFVGPVLFTVRSALQL